MKITRFYNFTGIILLAVLMILSGFNKVNAATAIVPTDYTTIQGAVDAVQNDSDSGEVIINSNAVFDEYVRIRESVTLRAGDGFEPVILRTTGYRPPIWIRATEASDTVIILQGLTVRASGDDVNTGIIISNVPESNTLDVTIDSVTVSVEGVQTAITVASATSLTITESFIEIEGNNAGGPVCVRLNPNGHNLTALFHKNIFRFSRASGISIKGGRDDVLVSTTIDANVFEGFLSDSGLGGTGVRISGTGSEGRYASATETTITNNLFLRASSAVAVNGQKQHPHTVFVNNNTIIDSRFNGLSFVAFGTSMVEATVMNNIVVGSNDYGIFRQGYGDAVVNLENNFNLLSNNLQGNYSGAVAGAGSLDVDPKFVNPGIGNYRLQSSSPAIDHGINTPPGGVGFGEDVDGNTRVQDGDLDRTATADIGAYELIKPYAPAISITPNSHDSGSVNVGSASSPHTLTITNMGDADLIMGTLGITGAGDSEFSIQNDNCSAQIISASGTCTVDIVFSPASEGIKSANLTIPSNDPNTPTLDVPLSGIGGICTYSISPAGKSFSPDGSTGSVSVTAADDCDWAASSNASWIGTASGSSGSGNGTVNYSVASNTSTSSRTGTMTIAGKTFTVTQSGTDPFPDIKANGSDGPVAPTGNLSITVALDPGSRSGDNADWWVAADTPNGWYYFNAGTLEWILAGASYTDLIVTYQGPLLDLATFDVLNMPVSGLPSGTYTFYFAIDMNMNGLLDSDEMFFDSVVVNITP